jgi:hypothetical protein
MAHHHHGAYALLLPVLVPLLLVYVVLSSVAGVLFFLISRPVPSLRKRFPLRKIARQFTLLLFIGMWGPGACVFERACVLRVTHAGPGWWEQPALAPQPPLLCRFQKRNESGLWRCPPHATRAHCVCGLFAPPIYPNPELDRVWMPAWRCCCRRTRFRYLHVSDAVTRTPPTARDSDSEPLEQEVAHLPAQPPGTVRLVFIRSGYPQRCS